MEQSLEGERTICGGVFIGPCKPIATIFLRSLALRAIGLTGASAHRLFNQRVRGFTASACGSVLEQAGYQAGPARLMARA